VRCSKIPVACGRSNHHRPVFDSGAVWTVRPVACGITTSRRLVDAIFVRCRTQFRALVLSGGTNDLSVLSSREPRSTFFLESGCTMSWRGEGARHDREAFSGATLPWPIRPNTPAEVIEAQLPIRVEPQSIASSPVRPANIAAATAWVSFLSFSSPSPASDHM